MKVFEKVDKYMTRFEEFALVIILTLMTIDVFVNASGRNLFSFVYAWSEEVARYLTVWAIFIGASLAVRKNIHVGIDAFVHFLPQTIQKYTSLLSQFISIIFCIVAGIFSVKLCMQIVSTGQVSAAMEMPMVFAYGAMPVGYLMMTIRYIMQISDSVAKMRKSALICGGADHV